MSVAVPYLVADVVQAAEGDPVCVTGGGCYTTIQGAVNAASAGATITVAAGTYNESVTINEVLTLKGVQAGVDARTRSGDATGESVINSSTGANLTISASDVTIDGFMLVGDDNHKGNIYTDNNYDNLSIINNVVKNSNPYNEAMDLYGGNNFLIQNNYLLDIAGEGIKLRNGNKLATDATNQKIINNKITGVRGVSGGAIKLYGQSGVEVSGNTISTSFEGISVGSDTSAPYYYMKDISIHNNDIEVVLDGSNLASNVYGIGLDGLNEKVSIYENTIKQTGVASSSYKSFALVRFSYDSTTHSVTLTT